uniref:Transmembrane protein n=1 Tax=Romanomermis culicivorax TaxID=13658 RepID=A0A915JTN4_ROMCU
MFPSTFLFRNVLFIPSKIISDYRIVPSIDNTENLWCRSMLFMFNLAWTSLLRLPFITTSLLVLFDVRFRLQINDERDHWDDAERDENGENVVDMDFQVAI